jgi:hypothetical protein
VERSVSFARGDCFGAERLFAITETRERALRWCLEDAGMHRHTTAQRLPREHFESVEKARVLPAPDSPYDGPIWSDPKVGRYRLWQVARLSTRSRPASSGSGSVRRRIGAWFVSTTARCW